MSLRPTPMTATPRGVLAARCASHRPRTGAPSTGADAPSYASAVGPRSAAPPRTDSPRLLALGARLAAAVDATAREAAVAWFWAGVEAAGAPLVEPVDRDPHHRIVTFVWRDADARAVVLYADWSPGPDGAPRRMRHLPGTDIWYLSCRLRADHRGTYRIARDGAADPEPGPAGLAARAVPDPLNPRLLPGRWYARPGSVVELPHAPAPPWAEAPEDVPPGSPRRHRLGSHALAAERDVWVYEPPGPLPEETDVVVLLDGDMWFGQLGFESALDRLIAVGLLPPLIVLAPNSRDWVGEATRCREFGGQDAQVTFLAAELLPWAAARWPVTHDPARTVVAGQGLGGVSALYAGYAAPMRFGNVLAQSAALPWHPAGEPEADADPVPWITRRYADGAPRELRLHLDVGLREGRLLDLTRGLRAALRARDYPVTGTEFNGGHDYACWRGALADGLITLLGARPR
ncbi:alpha/beta hydrolase-fold protein [Streptomyces buecherae]|uniref:alpha/beta hydrolase-fold protein n=1 Tax=Streptomyces buecherae TaxID=2763006 RepID=UPI00368EE8A4